MLRRRALTLLELLIAIAVVAAMAAIVAPNLLGRVDERRFVSTVDVLFQQLLLARAHAQATGETVEVFWMVDERSPSTGSVVRSHLGARLLRLDMPEEMLDADTPQPRIDRPEFSEPVSESDEDKDETTIYEPWAKQPLPRDIEITRIKPTWLSDASADGLGILGDEFEPDDALHDSTDSVRLAVFLPDGSALISEIRWLIDSQKRAAEMRINHWTGLPVIQRVEPGDEAIEEDAEEQESEFDDDVSEFEPAENSPPTEMNNVDDNSEEMSEDADDDAEASS